MRRVLIPPDISLSVFDNIDSRLPVHHLEGGAMGTTWHVRCVLPPGVPLPVVERELTAVFALVVRQMSHWEPESDLCQFNRGAPGEWRELPEEFYKVLSAALEVAAQSGGAYDPAMGKLIDLHGFGAAPVSDHMPTTKELEHLRKSGGWQHLKLDATKFLAFQPGGIHLNLSSIAKGHAVDLAAEKLAEIGAIHFLIEIGGELRGSGCKPDGTPWWCSLENPPGGEALPQTVAALCGLSVATSGDAVLRRITREGVRIGHLLDPRTGASVSGELAAVSVFAPSCLVADAWATAFFVAGEKDGLALAERFALPALFTVRNGEGYRQCWSTALEGMME